MKKRKRVFELLGVLLLMLLIPASAWAQGRKAPAGSDKKAEDDVLTIGVINNDGYRYFEGGCGDPQIWPRGRGKYGGDGLFYMLYSPDGALMKLNGRIVTVRMTERPAYIKLRKGAKFSERYSGGGFSVRLDYTVTSKPIEGEESTVAKYVVRITVTKDGVSRSVSGNSASGC